MYTSGVVEEVGSSGIVTARDIISDFVVLDNQCAYWKLKFEISIEQAA